jgi:parallel beta-helix repeat protein
MKKKHFYTAVILLSLLAAGIQPAHAVIQLTPTGWKDINGDDPGVGTWNLGTLTGTLTQNVDEPIEIKGNGLTLDGGGYTLTELPPSAQGYGVFINNQNGITVRNLKITGVDIGIWISNSNPGPAEPNQNTIENNEIYGCARQKPNGDWVGNGIKLQYAYATVIKNNNNIHDNWIGIQLYSSGKEDVFGDGYDFGNTITGNTLTDNAGGIYLDASSHNSLGGNTVTGDIDVIGDIDSANGFYLLNSHNNNLTGNTSSNNNFGIRLRDSSTNTLTNNTISNNRQYGIWLDPSNDNTINNNNFIENETQVEVISSTGNNFDGNYWSDWDPEDGTSYTFTGGEDETPWEEPYGWIEHNTPLRIIPSIINREGCLQRILAVIRFPEDITEEDIDIGQNLILYPGDSLVSVEATSQRIVTWCRWGTSRVSVFAFFTKDEVTAGVPENGPAEMMVIGRLTDGQYFCGLDDVRIISWSW